MKKRAVCELTPEQADRRGVMWILGAFVLCPCHLPITLWVVGALLSGTALGAVFTGHLFVAGAAISIVWLAATLHGFNLMRRARIDAYTDSTSRTLLRGDEK
jgi:cytochrome c biogenesis protein CcdA